MDLITPKLNEIIDAFLETEAEYLWFLNADNEYPPFTLRYLLQHNVDVVSAISPTHRNWLWTTAMRWIPAPTPKMMGSTPYFKPYRIDEIEGKIVGRKEVVASGHFCMLVKRHVFDNIRFRWVQHKARRCPNCGTGVKCLRQRYGSEYTFWMDAFMLGYKCRIDGRIVVGHLPQWPLNQYNVVEE